MRILAAILTGLSLAGCATHRIEVSRVEAPAAIDPPPRNGTFSIAADSRRLRHELGAAERELLLNDFVKVDPTSYEAQCAGYPYHLALSGTHIGPTDAGGHHYLTGFSLGLIPSWDNDHPHAEFVVKEHRQCNLIRSVKYTEYEKSLNWLLAVIAEFVVPAYRESECLVGQRLVTHFLNTKGPAFEC